MNKIYAILSGLGLLLALWSIGAAVHVFFSILYLPMKLSPALMVGILYQCLTGTVLGSLSAAVFWGNVER